jgi:hypothetical protein
MLLTSKPPTEQDEDEQMKCCVCQAPVSHEREKPSDPPEAEYDGEHGAYCPKCWDFQTDKPVKTPAIK